MTTTTAPAAEITEFETNQALNVFAKHWATLSWDAQDAITRDRGPAVEVARYQVWTCNSRSAYAISQSMRAAVLALAAAIERHVTSSAGVMIAP